MTTYLIAYFVINIILAFRVVRNAYFIPHPPEDEKELRDDVSYNIPLALLFGTILIVLEYIYRTIDGE
jgi:hypothetical protein